MKLYNYFSSFALLDALGVFSIFILYAFFAVTPIFAKKAILSGPMITYIALRFLCAGAFFLIWYVRKKKHSLSIKKQDIIQFANIAFLGIAASYMLLFWSLQYLTVAASALLLILTPFFTALFSWMHGFETFTYKKIAGLCIGAVGIIPLFMKEMPAGQGFLSAFSCDIPELLTLVSVILYAYSWIAFKQLMMRGYHEDYINGITMFTGGITIAIVAYFFDGWYQQVPIIAWGSYSFYVFLVVLVGIFSFSFYAHLLKRYSATLIAFFGFLEPFFTALFGLILLSETISAIMVLSFLIVSAGLYLFYHEELSLKR